MSARLFGRLGMLGALTATFFGVFLMAQAAVDVALTIDGVETITVAEGVEADYEVTISVTDDEVEEVLVSLVASGDDFLDEENLIGAYTNVVCGANGFDDSLEDQIDCLWLGVPGFEPDAPFSGSETISFTLSIDEAGEYALYVSSYLVNFGDFVDEEIILTVESDVDPFTFTSAEVYDEDGDGYIDTIKPSFSGGIPDIDTADTDDITVDGYTVSGVSHWEFGSEIDLDSLMITLEEGDTPDTGVTPDVTIADIDNRDGVTVTENTLTPTDESNPVFMSAVISEDGETIELTFSEDLNGTTVNSSGSDFSLSEGSITEADETDDGVVTLTLEEATGAETLDVTLVVGAINPNSVEDLRGHKAEEKTVSATRAEDSTPIVIESVGLATSGTSTDEVIEGDVITLTFSLAEAAATTTVDILDESDIDVATDGTTYTATYTVDADTPTGTVTFSISVLDAAGNESTADATTDESELTVVREEEDEDGGESGGGDDDDGLIDFSISLESDNGGLNLISLPVSPEDTDIEDVLDDVLSSVESVWTYIDGSWLVYHPNNPDFSTLTTMDAGYAYWVEVNADATLTGEGEIETNIRTLSTGWQMVGYLQPDISTDGSVSIDEAFFSVGLAGVAYSDLLLFNTDTGALESAVSVEPGDGFWMQVTDAEVELGSA